jgi:hypothetical protein
VDVITQMREERDRARQAAADKTRQLQELVSEYVGAIAAETAKAARLDQVIATLQQGAAYAPEPTQGAAPAEKEAPVRLAPADDQVSGGAEQMPVPQVSGLVAQVIVDALARAGAKGLSGSEVNDAVRDAGFTLDASEKNKTRLKNKNLVYHDRKAQHWYLKDPTKAPAS